MSILKLILNANLRAPSAILYMGRNRQFRLDTSRESTHARSRSDPLSPTGLLDKDMNLGTLAASFHICICNSGGSSEKHMN
jgi:hypothetical protein